MKQKTLIYEYLSGAELLRQSVAGMRGQLDATPIAGKWSTRQVVCHIADFEPIYADRIKRVLAEDSPALPGGDPNIFAARLAYDQRNVAEELELIEITRRNLARILQSLNETDFERTGVHSEDGPLSVEQLLKRITGHIPHHIRFIEEKRIAIASLS